MKKLLKDPVLGWFCHKCYEHKSHKHYAFINAITLKCSLCDENLERKSYTMAGGRDRTMAECPSGHTKISLPECLCGEKMMRTTDTVEGLKLNNPREDELSLEYRIAESEKKSWWNKWNK